MPEWLQIALFAMSIFKNFRGSMPPDPPILAPAFGGRIARRWQAEVQRFEECSSFLIFCHYHHCPAPFATTTLADVICLCFEVESRD